MLPGLSSWTSKRLSFRLIYIVSQNYKLIKQKQDQPATTPQIHQTKPARRHATNPSNKTTHAVIKHKPIQHLPKSLSLKKHKHYSSKCRFTAKFACSSARVFCSLATCVKAQASKFFNNLCTSSYIAIMSRFFIL